MKRQTRVCRTCERPFVSYDGEGGRTYCCTQCRRARSPAVYCFTCPDGRRYVGSRLDCRKREHEGIGHSNTRLRRALRTYPPKTWTYAVLQLLAPGCPVKALRRAEQQHIDRLRSWMPSRGFNVNPASVVDAASESLRAYRRSWQKRNRDRIAARAVINPIKTIRSQGE
jgi:hypothetical protein